MDTAQCVRSYKSLAHVERAFRTIKTVDLQIRPIHHRTADRVRAHIFLCMLAYYAEWHMRQALSAFLFADTDADMEAKQRRNSVATAQRSATATATATAKAKAKVAKRSLDDGSPVHSFKTLLAELANITKSSYKTKDSVVTAPHFEMMTTPNTKQVLAPNDNVRFAPSRNVRLLIKLAAVNNSGGHEENGQTNESSAMESRAVSRPSIGYAGSWHDYSKRSSQQASN